MPTMLNKQISLLYIFRTEWWKILKSFMVIQAFLTSHYNPVSFTYLNIAITSLNFVNYNKRINSNLEINFEKIPLQLKKKNRNVGIL